MIPDIKFGCVSDNCPSECIVCGDFLPCLHCEEDGCIHFYTYIEEKEE
jgi:hypothetical protein